MLSPSCSKTAKWMPYKVTRTKAFKQLLEWCWTLAWLLVKKFIWPTTKTVEHLWINGPLGKSPGQQKWWLISWALKHLYIYVYCYFRTKCQQRTTNSLHSFCSRMFNKMPITISMSNGLLWGTLHGLGMVRRCKSAVQKIYWYYTSCLFLNGTDFSLEI